MPFKFENLRIWKDSIELSNSIHLLISKFPKEERFILSSQIQRASDSIALNIAEGSTGQSNPEYVRFLGYALRSGIEVLSCLYLAKGRKLITDQDFEVYYNQTSKLIISIQALRKYIRENKVYP